MSTPQQQSEPLVVPAGAGALVELGDHRAHIKVSAQNTGGTFLLLDVEADPDGGVSPHLHTREDETFYILEGRFALLVGEQAIEGGPGDTVFAPRNVMHTWRCVSPEGGRALVLVTPGDNFEAALEVAQHGVTPSDPAELAALAERYGIEMLPAVK